MRVFLDANVLISVVNEEYPVYAYSARIVSLAQNPGFKIFTSPLSLAITFYFAEKKNKRRALEKIKFLAGKLHITSQDEKVVSAALGNKQIHDFEDGLQYYSALDSGCTAIISEDGADFHFSEIEVLRSREFMERYVF
jgi:predicted nucleic acid-binding protein